MLTIIQCPNGMSTKEKQALYLQRLMEIQVKRKHPRNDSEREKSRSLTVRYFVLCGTLHIYVQNSISASVVCKQVDRLINLLTEEKSLNGKRGKHPVL